MTGQPPKPTLADYFKNYGVESGTLESLFDRLCLPLPLQGQYFATSDGGANIFLNRFGVVMRISQPERDRVGERQEKFRPEPVDHPAVVQPIITFRHAELQVEILPAQCLGWEMNDVTFLQEKLKADGVDFHDRGIENIGYMYVATPRHPRGLPVVIDRNSVKRVSNIPPIPDPDYDYVRKVIKETLEDELRPQFERVWGNGRSPVDRKEMVGFWSECMGKLAAGLTKPGWMHAGFEGIIHYHLHGQTSEAQKVSKRYDGRLDTHMRSLGLAPPALSAADLGLDY